MARLPKLLAGCRVLVVEDEFLVLLAIEGMLSDLGCDSITSAGSIEEAITLAPLQKFDCALLDLNLKGVRSYPVAEALEKLGIPFAFSTGYTDSIANTAYCDRPVLQKPYEREAFVETITGLLGDRVVVQAGSVMSAI